MRHWMLFLMWAGCGQMYQTPGGQSQPTQPPAAGGFSGSEPGAGGEPGQRPSGPGPDDPYATAAFPAPARGAPGPATTSGDASHRAPPKATQPPGPATASHNPPKASPGISSEAEAIVEAHNRVRAKHCAGPLAWSPKLAQVAQRWANSLRDQGCRFGHSNGSYGENLAAGSIGLLDPEAVVKMWYDESKDYKFPNGGFSMQTGHFTQVVWRGTKQVGCGRSQCKGMDIWVCEYDPPGNWEGQYAENVLSPGCHQE